MFKWLYSVKETLRTRETTICGFKFVKPSTLKPHIYDFRTYMMAQSLHKNFEKYRGIYTGKDIVIVGSGPTVNFYEPLKNTVNIGLNFAFLNKNVKFDYLFLQDSLSDDATEGFVNYRPDDCVKVIGLYSNESNRRVRQSTIARLKRKEVYVLNNRRPDKSPTVIDISVEPFAWYKGTIFGALQFALFTNPRKIYLVGFDCNRAGNSYIPQETNWFNHDIQFEYWHMFKDFVSKNYEQNEIISVNPVNLKGLFKDVYTQSYLDEHPEISKDNVEII